MENPFRKVMERRRAEIGISQAEAAKMAGVVRSTWNSWESLHEFPRMETWKVIAKVLQMPIEKFEQAGAVSWYAQCGLSPFEAAQLRSAGDLLDGALPAYTFASEDLRQLDQQLDVEVNRIEFAWWGKELAQLRGNIRRVLIAQDAAYQEAAKLVETFRAMYTAMVSRPNIPPIPKKRKRKAKMTGKRKENPTSSRL